MKALEAPIRQIAENSGVEGSIVVGKVSEHKSQTCGFNAQTEEYVDMIEAGIVDPAKVVRTALQDAASVAGLLITTEAMVAEMPKEKPAHADGRWRRRRHGRHGLLSLAPLETGSGKGGRRAALFVGARRLCPDAARREARSASRIAAPAAYCPSGIGVAPVDIAGD